MATGPGAGGQDGGVGRRGARRPPHAPTLQLHTEQEARQQPEQRLQSGRTGKAASPLPGGHWDTKSPRGNPVGRALTPELLPKELLPEEQRV